MWQRGTCLQQFPLYFRRRKKYKPFRKQRIHIFSAENPGLPLICVLLKDQPTLPEPFKDFPDLTHCSLLLVPTHCAFLMVTAHYSIQTPLLLVSCGTQAGSSHPPNNIPPRSVVGALHVLELVKHNSRQEERYIPNGWVAAWTFPKDYGKSCHGISAIRSPRQAYRTINQFTVS